MPDSAPSPSSASSVASAFRRRLPIGAEPIDSATVHVRVWAPRVSRVQVVTRVRPTHAARSRGRRLLQRRVRARRPAIGTASGWTTTRRCIRIRRRDFSPKDRTVRPKIIDPRPFPLDRPRVARIAARRPDHLRDARRHVHAEGTWAAAARELPELARIGVTMIEVMPVAEFEGRFGWGYDGVDLFAPIAPVRHARRLPALRRPRARAAASASSSTSSTTISGRSATTCARSRRRTSRDRYENEWGDAINFDGPDAGPVREFFVANAGYWIDEFHLDGLRLDATQQIFDDSPRAHRRRRSAGARARRPAAGTIVIVAENEPQDTRLVRPIDEGGYGLDALWNDDFHHSAMVALTGRAEAYYSDTRGDAAGVHLGGEVRLPVSGAALPAGSGSRAARRRCGLPPARVRHLPAEPRSGRELGARAARPIS